MTDCCICGADGGFSARSSLNLGFGVDVCLTPWRSHVRQGAIGINVQKQRFLRSHYGVPSYFIRISR